MPLARPLRLNSTTRLPPTPSLTVWVCPFAGVATCCPSTCPQVVYRLSSRLTATPAAPRDSAAHSSTATTRSNQPHQERTRFHIQPRPTAAATPSTSTKIRADTLLGRIGSPARVRGRGRCRGGADRPGDRGRQRRRYLVERPAQRGRQPVLR